MKLEKAGHDHLLTKWLKVIIFSLLMLAPLISVGTRCAYVVCNKNAYQSASITTPQIQESNTYNTNVVNNENDLIVGNIYQFNMVAINDIFTIYPQEIYILYNNNISTYSLGGYIDVYRDSLEIAIETANAENYLNNITNYDLYFVFDLLSE